MIDDPRTAHLGHCISARRPKLLFINIRDSRIVMRAVFYESQKFTAARPDYLTDDAYRELQDFLLLNPDAGEVMQGTGGFRKIRWADRRRGKGRRGGLRVIYYWLAGVKQIWLFAVYDKDEMSDLSAAEKKVLKREIENELKSRGAI
jgi:mRNA-degrading endonuclease RelE of RelBE toxin-antitoxin system